MKSSSKSVAPPKSHQARAVASSINQTNAATASMSDFQRVTLRYQATRELLLQGMPMLAEILPVQWPQTPSTVDPRRTLVALRSATSTLNEGLLVVGFGDGSVIERLRQDPVGRSKLIHVLILSDEADAFAHALGLTDFPSAFKELHLDVHYLKNVDDLARVMSTIFSNHAQIARLAGTALLDSHPLMPAAERQRAEWLPMLKKIIVERYDCLGNDVYDTFMGAKHSLMHGEKLVRQRRSSDYRNRYAGKTALCIASGPSVADYYERIRAIQHEHIIICADSILDGLLNNGIEPDFVCMVERPEEMHCLVDEFGPKCKALMVALPVVHPGSVNPFGERVVWWWNADDLYPWLDPQEPRFHSGRSAGTITVAFAGVLGVKTAYLIGHDLAFKEGQSHSVGANAFAFEAQKAYTAELSRTSPNYYTRLVDAQRNGGGSLETQGLWEIFRSDIVSIILTYTNQTEFINLNIATKTGVAISGTVEGTLPTANGNVLEKSHPQRTVSADAWPKYRERCLKLHGDFIAIKKAFADIAKELNEWRPLAQDRKVVEAMGTRVDLTKIVSKENSEWFGYVFRAALRNLMVRLHHNTYVRTMPERNWNQVQIIGLFVQSIPSLLDRLQPELDKALESFS
jgi:hypothetical protein